MDRNCETDLLVKMRWVIGAYVCNSYWILSFCNENIMECKCYNETLWNFSLLRRLIYLSSTGLANSNYNSVFIKKNEDKKQVCGSINLIGL